MGEGGGFPPVWAVVSFVSLGSPMACPSTKGVPESELTNLLVGLMQVRVSNYSLSLFLVPSRSSSMPLYPNLVLRAGSVPRIPHIPLFDQLRVILSLIKNLEAHQYEFHE
jgi:hypothetical protein